MRARRVVGDDGLDPEHGGDPFRREHLARRAVGDQAAAVHHHDAVGEARGEREVVHDREHRAAVMRGARQQLHHHQLMARIERDRRLVGEQDRRLARERPRQRDARALAAGERGHRAMGELRGVRGRERLGDGGRSASVTAENASP